MKKATIRIRRDTQTALKEIGERFVKAWKTGKSDGGALQFPRFGEFHIGCEWVTVIAQGVPAHVGAEAPDPYCHRPAYRSQGVIGILEPADDRRNRARA